MSAHSPGQALVETALVLPVLLLLLVMAIDFGRVFLGWVALQNAARIGADYAAETADAWNGMPPEFQEKRDRYAAIIEADMRAINCALAGGTPPDPTFKNVGGDPAPYDDGDYAVVELECSFDLITPLAVDVVGGPVNMIAHEEFPIHRAITVGVPSPPPLPGCPVGEAEVPDMVGETMEDALAMWVAEGFAAANFDPPLGVVSTGPPSGRNNLKIVLSHIPAESAGCVPDTTSVDVTHS